MAAYDEVLARNARAYRSRKGIGQERLAARMRALGYTAFLRQTVSKVEKGERRLSVAEVLGLALCLEVTMRQLLEPQPDDKQVELPNGDSLSERTVRLLVSEVNNHAIYWKDDVPVRRQGWAGWEGDPDAPDAVKAAWASVPDDERAEP
jgi:transcriptional regulator with XRE-family HTH domain